MNRHTLYFLGLFLGVVCGVSASMGTMPSLDDYGVVSEKGSRLAKDATLSGLYNGALADLSELQGSAEMAKELHALADWTGLKKGKAPKHFHKRLSTLKKTVRQTEWLTDKQKKVAVSLINRLGRKKMQHATEAAVVGSLTAAVVVACLGAAAVAKMRKNKKTGCGGGGDPYEGGSAGFGFGEGPSGGMGYWRRNFPAALRRGHEESAAPPLAASANRSWWDILRTAPKVPTDAQPHDLPDAPYGPVQQHQAGVPAGLQRNPAEERAWKVNPIVALVGPEGV